MTPAEPNLPPSPANQNNPKRNAKELREWLRFVVEVVGLCALIFYACTTVKIWCEMQSQTLRNDLHSRKQLRPWIGIKGDTAEIVAQPTSSDGTSWTIQVNAWNYGVTPARAVVGVGHLQQVRDDWRGATACDRAYTKSKKWQHPDVSTEAIFPNSGNENFRIETVPTTDIRPPQFVAACIAYQDVEGGFLWYLQGKDTCITYSTQVLYRVVYKGNEPTLKRDSIVVEGAAPTPDSKSTCSGSE